MMLKGRQCVEVLITLKSLQEAEYQSGSGRGDWSVGGGLPPARDGYIGPNMLHQINLTSLLGGSVLVGFSAKSFKI